MALRFTKVRMFQIWRVFFALACTRLHVCLLFTSHKHILNVWYCWGLILRLICNAIFQDPHSTSKYFLVDVEIDFHMLHYGLPCTYTLL